MPLARLAYTSSGGITGLQANAFLSDAFGGPAGPVYSSWAVFGANVTIQGTDGNYAKFQPDPANAVRAIIKTDLDNHADWSVEARFYIAKLGFTFDDLVLFQFKDIKNFCYVNLCGTAPPAAALQFASYINGKVTYLAPDYNLSTSILSHKIRVVKRGNVYTVYDNGNAAMTFTGTTGLEANNGFGLGAGGDKGDIAITNFSVAP